MSRVSCPKKKKIKKPPGKDPSPCYRRLIVKGKFLKAEPHHEFQPSQVSGDLKFNESKLAKFERLLLSRL